MQHPTLIIPVTGNPFVCLSFNKKNSFEIENKLEQKLYYLYLTEEKNQSLVFDGADYQNKHKNPFCSCFWLFI